MSTPHELDRLATAVKERMQRWRPVIVALDGAESGAWEQFHTHSVYRRPYAGNDVRDKRQAWLGSFKNTFVQGMMASRFVGYLYSGIGSGTEYFQMIFNQLHGRAQTRFKKESAWGPDPNAFHDLRDRFERVTAEVLRNLEKLKQALRSETKVLPADHVRNAYATMLFSPILYPPAANPDSTRFELAIEWQMWLYFFRYLLPQVSLDFGRKRIGESPLVDMSLMFVRLKHILMRTGGAGIKVPDQMQNLDKFRADCEEGRITENNVSVRDHLDLPLPVQFPAVVKKWIAADGEQSREMMKRAQMHISMQEAKI